MTYQTPEPETIPDDYWAGQAKNLRHALGEHVVVTDHNAEELRSFAGEDFTVMSEQNFRAVVEVLRIDERGMKFIQASNEQLIALYGPDDLPTS